MEWKRGRTNSLKCMPFSRQQIRPIPTAGLSFHCRIWGPTTILPSSLPSPGLFRATSSHCERHIRDDAMSISSRETVLFPVLPTSPCRKRLRYAQKSLGARTLQKVVKHDFSSPSVDMYNHAADICPVGLQHVREALLSGLLIAAWAVAAE